MADPPRTALAHVDTPVLHASGPDGDALHVAALEHRGRFLLRARAGDVAAMEGALGGSLPAVPNTTRVLDGGRVFWLGPDEWLADLAEPAAARVRPALLALARERPIAVVDVSHAWAGFHLAGTRALDVLRKGCPIDLDPRRFAPDACARTLLGNAGVLLWRCRGEDAARFGLATDRSYAHHVWRWLADAAREFLPDPGAREPDSPSSATPRRNRP